MEKENSDYYEYYEDFLDEPTEYLDKLMKEIEFSQGQVTVYGKEFNEPRLTAWFANSNEEIYKYSGKTTTVLEWTPTLKKLKNKVNSKLNIDFNSALCNLYRNGEDYIGWHSDSETGIDARHVASISLGEERKFKLRSKSTNELIFDEELKNGSLFYMKGDCQKYFKHHVPKQKKKIHPRLNITFRITTKN